VAILIAVGSLNPVKIAAAEAALRQVYGDGIDVTGVEAASGVPVQPWGNEESLRGALNRARAAREAACAQLGVGFEGGLLDVAGQTFTCAWCAVVAEDGTTGVAGGESILLPPSVAAAVRNGAELGPAMDQLTGLHNTKQAGGAIGNLTRGLLTRQSAYEHLLLLAMARLRTPEFYKQG